MTFRIEHPEFHASVADLRGACDLIATVRGRAGAHVGTLLGDGWSGRAADAFGEAWSDWLAASETVVRELGSLSDTLAAVHAAATEADTRAVDSLAWVAGRLG